VNESERLRSQQGDILTELLRQFHLANENAEQQRRSLEAFATRIDHRQSDSSYYTGESPLSRALITSGSPNDSIGSPEGHYYDSVFKLDISRFRKLSCKPFCSCPCHRRFRRKTSSTTNKFLGHLFLGYSSLPFLGPTCEDGCTQKTRFSTTFTYYFPAWFVFKKALSFVMMTTPLGDLGGVIKVRKLSRDFSIFRFASVGDIAGIKRLLERRAAHPSAGFWGNWTPLHVCIKSSVLMLCADCDSMPFTMDMPLFASSYSIKERILSWKMGQISSTSHIPLRSASSLIRFN